MGRKCETKGYTENGTRPARGAGWAGRPGPTGPGGPGGISQPHQGGEGPYSHSKVGTHPRHEGKDYKEVSPEPKDYGGDYSDDHSPSSWAAAEREDNDLYCWEEVPKEKTVTPQVFNYRH
jgi:hypothetical protein